MCANLHFLRYLSVYSKYGRSILAVDFGVYGRILGSIRRILGVYGDFPPSTHATILINYLPPPLASTHDAPTHKHIVPEVDEADKEAVNLLRWMRQHHLSIRASMGCMRTTCMWDHVMAMHKTINTLPVQGEGIGGGR